MKLAAMTKDPSIQVMKQFRQHHVSNTFEHVCHVADMSHKIEKIFHLKVDEDALLQGSILHDYYLYENHEFGPVGGYRHGISHADKALKNAQEKFELDGRVENIIHSHMWPLNLTHLPRCKEAWIVTVSDKVCAFEEMLLHRRFTAYN